MTLQAHMITCSLGGEAQYSEAFIGTGMLMKTSCLYGAVRRLRIDLDPCRIMKVKDFLKLARLSEADGHLQQKLKQLLKLSKEKWDAACEHAKTAVQVRLTKSKSTHYCLPVPLSHLINC